MTMSLVVVGPCRGLRRASTSSFPFFFSCSCEHRVVHSFLHDALPISGSMLDHQETHLLVRSAADAAGHGRRSEEHTSELQSRQYLVCRLLLEKKNLDGSTVRLIAQPTHP